MGSALFSAHAVFHFRCVLILFSVQRHDTERYRTDGEKRYKRRRDKAERREREQVDSQISVRAMATSGALSGAIVSSFFTKMLQLQTHLPNSIPLLLSFLEIWVSCRRFEIKARTADSKTIEVKVDDRPLCLTLGQKQGSGRFCSLRIKENGFMDVRNRKDSESVGDR